MTINGLVVVRLPHLNYLVPERDTVPCIDGIYYTGIDRQRWADVFDEDFYAKSIPEEIAGMARIVRAKPSDFTGIDLCQDLTVASRLLAYSNRKATRNELIAVRSPSLKDIKGEVDLGLNVEWVGFDFLALGEWSLILGGLFTHPEHYSAWTGRLNSFGLFNKASLLAEYSLAYDQAVAAEQSEPLAPDAAGYRRIAIEIGQVQADCVLPLQG
jgi:hypothetical protein